MPQGVNGGVGLAPSALLVPVKTGAPPLSGVDCTVRLSRMTARGWGIRAAASRSRMRRSCAIAAKTPAASQRRVC
jgi:hypothetical protein